MRNLFAWALLGLLMLVPAAMAEETKPAEEAPDEATYDCPPDAEVCAFGADDCIECSGMADDPAANGTDEPTYGDCGGEVCAYDGGAGSDGNAGNGTDRPTYGECRPEATVCALGPDDCIDCMGPIESHQGSCMDGTATNCDDVQYLDGRGPAGCENCRGEELQQSGDATKASPSWTPVVILAIGALALIVNRFR